jgi:hypothetical protein
LRTDGVRRGGCDVVDLKKGFMAVVPRARRSGVSKGKQGFVKIPVGEMKVRLCVRERRRRVG